MSFSEMIRHSRNVAGISQGEMASRLGVKQGTYAAYERREGAQIPSIVNAAKMAKICNVSLDYLAGLTDDPTPRWKVDAAPASVKDATAEVQSPPASAPTEMTPAEVTASIRQIQRALTAAGIELK